MDFSNVLNNTYTLVLLSLLALSLIALCLYYGLVWLRVARRGKGGGNGSSSGGANGKLPSVSVVIFAHNQADSLRKSLPYLLEQEYDDYEVVVVDYLSQDDTAYVLRVCTENYPNIKTYRFREDVNLFQGKKYPLSIGIKLASKEVILLTEPDCVPKSFDWIKQMVTNYGRGTEIVIGHTLLRGGKSLLNALQQYDNMTYNASFLASALMGIPYTASGRNLSYRRDFFFRCGGFIRHYPIRSGADDLFVNQNARKQNTTISVNNDAAVLYDAHPDFHHWHFDYSTRRSTYRYHSWRDRLARAVYPLAQILFIGSLVWLWVAGLFPWQILVAVLALRLIWEILCAFFLAKKFETKNICWFAPFFELYFLFLNTILTLVTLPKKKQRFR